MGFFYMQNAFNRIDELIQQIPDEKLQEEFNLAVIDLLAVLTKNGVREFLRKNDLLKDG